MEDGVCVMVKEICDEFGRTDPIEIYAKVLVPIEPHPDTTIQVLGARKKLYDVCIENGMQVKQMNLVGVGAPLSKFDKSDYWGREFMDTVKTIFSIGFVVVMVFRGIELFMGGA